MFLPVILLTQGLSILIYVATDTASDREPTSSKRTPQWSTMNGTTITNDDLPWDVVDANDEATKPKLHAFYNMFIPPSQEAVSQVVWDLISEQLTQMLAAFAERMRLSYL
jgi:hypothetical protein